MLKGDGGPIVAQKKRKRERKRERRGKKEGKMEEMKEEIIVSHPIDFYQTQ